MPVRFAVRAATLFLVFCSFAILDRPVRGEGDPQKALLDLEKRWLEAEDNPSTLESILADDFVHVLPFGFITKREQLSYMRARPVPEGRVDKHFEDLRVRTFVDVGVVNGIVVAVMGDGKVRKTVFTDVFAYRAGRWQAVNAQELPFNESARP